MHRRTAPRLARILACAAVPVMLVATGCSSDDSGGKKKESAKPTQSAKPTSTASVKPAAYGKLPEVCKTLSEKTVDKLVPKAEKKEGKALPSTDTNDSASCFWSGLNDEDVKDLQFRSLTVSLKRFPSDPTLGSGEKRAQDFAAQQTTKAATQDGAKDAKTEKAGDVGDDASVVSTQTKKDDNDFTNETVVARSQNVVVSVKYSGAGYEGAKSPNADDMKKDAQEAAKEVVAAVANANKQ
ncbi:hypothetical protein BLA24_04215 [Streptomyces cinnamoneus]|uniref:DUF3558 domain-containing protein n=1 Tax=Streptomyces cinnamoneus TaxID=53446 RepID=A0A2G1XP89_STRCJ|nr:hypothetical protein [Streptomyces cinnamoneus]PHQ53030.1 hypothetical protein BLA24_04215 [Streptomyces cinnamoneus]PPT13862.1 hypothetical protein CYQ11_14045 [Streptomyces cinnamoneus]